MYPTRAGEILNSRLLRGFSQLGKAITVDNPAGMSPDSAPDVDFSVLLRSSHLLTLIALAETQTIANAAHQLGVSEKSVTRTIRHLEHRLGRDLLLKDYGVARLSFAGEGLSRAAKLFFREIDLAREEIAAERGLTQGRLAIGGLPLARSFILPKAMVQFAMKFPEMNVQLLEGAYESLLSKLGEGDIDIMVGALRPDLDQGKFSRTILFEEYLCVVARSDHPIFDRTPGREPDVFAYPWIAPRSRSPARKQFDALIAHTRNTPRILMEVASHIAVRAVLMESDALALLSRHQIRYEVRDGKLSIVPVALDQWPRQIGYVVRSGWQPTPSQRSFLQELEIAVGQSLPEQA